MAHPSTLLGLTPLPLLVLVSLAIGTACTAERSSEPRQARASRMFFENSSRRDPTAEESSRIAYVGGCTGFFIESSAKKSFVVSARHCFADNDIQAWCAGKPEVYDANGTVGTCRRIVAADDRHDIAIFESDLRHATRGNATLLLGAYVPTVRTRLLMVGYPADEDPETARNGRPTTTEDCWTLTEDPEPSPHERADHPTFDLSLRHNCTTYGGNSGGPIIVEGTRDVIGLPYTYMPHDYQRREAENLETATTLALMADFVGEHQATLSAEGITLASGRDDRE